MYIFKVEGASFKVEKEQFLRSMNFIYITLG